MKVEVRGKMYTVKDKSIAGYAIKTIILLKLVKPFLISLFKLLLGMILFYLILVITFGAGSSLGMVLFS